MRYQYPEYSVDLTPETLAVCRDIGQRLLEEVGIGVDRWRTEGFLGFCLFMNSDVLVVNRWLRFVPGIRMLTRGFVLLDRATGKLPGLKGGGLQVICTAIKKVDQ